jgi:hypothetical protein
MELHTETAHLSHSHEAVEGNLAGVHLELQFVYKTSQKFLKAGEFATLDLRISIPARTRVWNVSIFGVLCCGAALTNLRVDQLTGITHNQ